MLISIEVAEASDSWGFVGVIRVGAAEAYRTLEAFPSRTEAERHTQALVGGTLGELLAGQEWRHVRDSAAHTGAPTRRDFRLGSLFGQVDEPSAADS
ncbi:MAG TPA: hypothetical protein VHA79_06890 [Mycobacteriales bacterium]|jgi:hypothetical protein|nr:hypothetical protein [Mycobacteriales bacterium]